MYERESKVMIILIWNIGYFSIPNVEWKSIHIYPDFTLIEINVSVTIHTSTLYFANASTRSSHAFALDSLVFLTFNKHKMCFIFRTQLYGRYWPVSPICHSDNVLKSFDKPYNLPYSKVSKQSEEGCIELSVGVSSSSKEREMSNLRGKHLKRTHKACSVNTVHSESAADS